MLNNAYPVLLTGNPEDLAEFYVRRFGMTVTFRSDWYVSLKREGGQGLFQLATLRFDHPTIPEGFRRESEGILLNWEVEDVDAVHHDLIAGAGLPVHLELRSEDWGQRHFITSDPDGTLQDVIQIIEPSPEFLAQYAEGLQ